MNQSIIAYNLKCNAEHYDQKNREQAMGLPSVLIPLWVLLYLLLTRYLLVPSN